MLFVTGHFGLDLKQITEKCVCVDWQKTSLSLSARTTTPQILGVALLLVSRSGQRSGQGQPHANVPGLSSLSLTLFVLSTGTKPQGQWKKTTTTDFFLDVDCLNWGFFTFLSSFSFSFFAVEMLLWTFWSGFVWRTVNFVCSIVGFWFIGFLFVCLALDWT